MKAYLKIEMPKSCASCEWSKLSKMDLEMSCFCTLTKKIGSLEIAKNNRMDFCPLIPVPPHGRLIDADAFAIRIEEEAKKFVAMNEYDSGLRTGYRTAIKAAKLAPTIIPADESKEETC